MKKRISIIYLTALILLTAGCSAQSTVYEETADAEPGSNDESVLAVNEDVSADKLNNAAPIVVDSDQADIPDDVTESEADESEITFSLDDYTGEPYEEINGNHPFFEEYEYVTDPFEYYSSLDELGRCGEAYANICRELMPTEDRENISSVIPSGWNNNPYDFIDGGYVYNRCHLIAFSLAGENANEFNLITGTRYFNVTGMLPFENMVADYVNETDNHVLYRVTPVYEGDNLVADGVLMEAYSVEDEGGGIEFCVFVFNVQPGVTIDYATGENRSDGTMESSSDDDAGTSDTGESVDYILNTHTMRFHYPDCDSVSQMSDKNKQEYTGSRQTLIDEGYVPCGACQP